MELSNESGCLCTLPVHAGLTMLTSLPDDIFPKADNEMVPGVDPLSKKHEELYREYQEGKFELKVKSHLIHLVCHIVVIEYSICKCCIPMPVLWWPHVILGPTHTPIMYL